MALREKTAATPQHGRADDEQHGTARIAPRFGGDRIPRSFFVGRHSSRLACASPFMGLQSTAHSARNTADRQPTAVNIFGRRIPPACPADLSAFHYPRQRQHTLNPAGLPRGSFGFSLGAPTAPSPKPNDPRQARGISSKKTFTAVTGNLATYDRLSACRIVRSAEIVTVVADSSCGSERQQTTLTDAGSVGHGLGRPRIKGRRRWQRRPRAASATTGSRCFGVAHRV